jgi:transposase
MRKEYLVSLSQEEREQLKQLIASGTVPARTQTHARVLLKADQGPEGPGWPDPNIAQAVEVSRSTIGRVRQRFAKEGLAAALGPRPSRREYRRKLDGRQEAHLVAVACSAPPEGQGRWTLRLLADRMVELEYVEDLSYQTVRRVLKKTDSSPG